MFQKIDHIVITTENPLACLDFYQKLGFEARSANSRYELFAGDFKINVHVKGKELSPHAKAIQPGSADMCFEITSSLSEFQEKIEKNGLSVLLGMVARTGVRGKMQSIYLRDPDGNLVECCKYE